MPAEGVATDNQSAIASKKPDFSSADKLESEIKVVEKTCLEISIQDIDNVPVPKVEDPKSKGAKKPDPNSAKDKGFDL